MSTFILPNINLHLVVRIIKTVLVASFSFFLYRLFSFIFSIDPLTASFTYQTPLYLGLIFHESMLVAKPMFLSIVPGAFFIFIIWLERTQVKKLVIFVIIGGVVVSCLLLIFNLRSWHIGLRAIETLPITHLIYTRWNGGALSSHGTRITFTIPQDSYLLVDQIITERLPKINSELAQLGYPIQQARFYVEKTTPDGKRLDPYDDDKFINSAGTIKGTIDIR